MKRTLLCAAALLSMSSLSFAADLPSRALAPAPVYLAPAFTWTGFYIGGNIGAAWTGHNDCPVRDYRADSTSVLAEGPPEPMIMPVRSLEISPDSRPESAMA